MCCIKCRGRTACWLQHFFTLRSCCRGVKCVSPTCPRCPLVYSTSGWEVMTLQHCCFWDSSWLWSWAYSMRVRNSTVRSVKHTAPHITHACLLCLEIVHRLRVVLYFLPFTLCVMCIVPHPHLCVMHKTCTLYAHVYTLWTIPWLLLILYCHPSHFIAAQESQILNTQFIQPNCIVC